MTEQSQTNEVVLEVEGITKRFPGVLANDNVSMKLHRGEILALLGENGAGKSTLMNVIYGLYHPDEGTIKLKGKTVRFASPREAIHSGIGMVHQHFQLVNVMTVADNVVLGEEASVAYQGKENSPAQWVIRWLPSLVVFALSLIIGLALNKLEYLLGGAGIGVALATAVAFPPVARVIWGAAWRVGLAFIMGAIATRVELVTEVGFTALALRQKVETLDEMRPKTMEGYEVKRTVVIRERIPFDWASEARKAEDAETGIPGVLDSAQAQLEVYRGNGVPAWMLDAIEDAPPITHGVSLALLLGLVGAYTLSSWRGIEPVKRRLQTADLVALGVLALLYTGLTWRELDQVSSRIQIGVSALVLLVLAFVILDTINRRRKAAGYEGKPSVLDEGLDSFLALLNSLTEIRNPRAAAERVRELSRQYGLEVDPDAVVEKLPVGMQQRVEIVKALYRKADILILDEPTAVLTPQEGRELFRIMRELAAQGVTIIFITHKLKEVFEVASHIVVMRGGRVVGTTTPDQATEPSLAAMMVGREVILQVEKDEAHPAEAVLQVRKLEAYDKRGAMALRQVDFDVRAGEVLGVAGVQGNGQTELVEVLTGLRPLIGGTVRLLGLELQPDCQPIAQWRHRLIAFVIDTAAVAALTYFFAYFVWYFSDDQLYEASAFTQIMTALLVFTVIDMIWFLGGWLAGGGTVGMSLFSL
ncbi:MAG: ATP-binding cassette domain-containing protein, partial [Chloroflexi bacterium]|nr:ATP-binding cassette domain-containing protein [Chloroflexota bacterium]